jgi:hypothetical protein
VKGWKKIFQANGTRKQARIAILIADKADFKPKLEETSFHIDKENSPSG